MPVLLWVLAALLALSTTVSATEWFVAPPGTSGGRAGCSQSRSAPQTDPLNTAIGCLGRGDTLTLLDGTYSNNGGNTFAMLDANAVPDGTSNSARTLIHADHPHGALIMPPDGTTYCISMRSSRSFVTYDGIDCDQSNATSFWNGALDFQGDVTPNGCGNQDRGCVGLCEHDITVSRMDIRNLIGDTSCVQHCAGTTGLSLGSLSYDPVQKNFLVDQLTIHDIGYNQPTQCNCGAGAGDCNFGCNLGYGVYWSGSGYTMQNTTITKTTGYSIHGNGGNDCVTGDPSPQSNIIRNNTMDNTGELLMEGPNNQIYNNVLSNIAHGPAAIAPPDYMHCLHLGQYGPSDAHDDQVYGNTCFNIGPTTRFGQTIDNAFQIVHGSGTVHFKNNVAYPGPSNGVTSALTPDSTIAIDGANNKCTNAPSAFQCTASTTPNFVNPNATPPNLHLAGASGDLYNSGTNAPGAPFNIDHDGVSRPRAPATRWAIGAYEFVPTGPAPPTIAMTTPTAIANGGSATLTIASTTLSGVAGTATTTSTGLQVTFTCSGGCTPTNGSATGTTSWSLPSLTLTAGVHALVVTASDNSGAGSSSVTLNVTANPPVSTIAITAPVTTGTYSTTTGTVSVSGTVSLGGTATIQSLTWTCPGCASTSRSGTLPNSTPWTVSTLTLATPAPSTQTFTVTLTDSLGHTAAAALAITLNTTAGGGGAICDPSNYPGFVALANSAPMPYNFCAYGWNPYRNRLPDNPQSIDSANTTKLQTQYVPGSAISSCSWCAEFETSGTQVTDPSTQGGSGYPVYTASTSDPTITVNNCSGLQYGCSDSNGNRVSSIPGTWHIPPYARSSRYQFGDHNIEIIQPDGRSLSMYACVVSRDWQNGDTVGNGGSQCTPEGITYSANIVTDGGVNIGNLNGGDNFAALPIHYQDLVVHGQINHPMVFWITCVSNSTYPGVGAAECSPSGSGMPSGIRIWLSMTRAEIDSFAAANPNALPQFLKPIAYALHEYGAYMLDTGAAGYGMSQAGLEDLQPELEKPGGPAQSEWATWMGQHGGGISGDHQAKLFGVGQVIDWGSFPANRFFALSNCYAHGTCPDSLPPPSGTGANPPQIAITSPVTTGSYLTTSTTVTLSGTTTAGTQTVQSVTWSCPACPTTSGTAGGTVANWSITNLALHTGTQTVTVTASTGAGGLTAAAAIAITVSVAGAPTITMTTPVAIPNGGSAGLTVGSATLSGVAGTASSSSTGLVVNWSCSGGCTPSNGQATQPLNWTVPSLTLTQGAHALVVTASDNSGFSSSVTLNVTYTPGRVPVKGTFYIASAASVPSGDDTRTCTQAQSSSTPLATLAVATQCALAESTFRWLSGTYTEFVDDSVIPLAGGTSWTNPMILEAAPGATVLWQPPLNAATARVALWFRASSSQFILVRNITVNGNNGQGGTAAVQGSAHDIHLVTMAFQASRWQGVEFDTANNQLLTSTVNTAFSTSISCVQLSSSTNAVVRGNTLSGCGGGGVVDGAGVATTGSVIDSNRIHDPISGDTSPAILLMSNSNGALVMNNVVFNYTSGIQVAGAGTAKIFNNTVTQTTQATNQGIYLTSSAANAQVTNNIVYQAGGITADSGVTVTYVANFCQNAGNGCAYSGNPLFLGTGTDPYSLQPLSPAIDKGVVLSQVTVDIVGVTRPQPTGGAYDIGAYEFQQNVVIPPPGELRLVNPWQTRYMRRRR